jgi:hypothetical protein
VSATRSPALASAPLWGAIAVLALAAGAAGAAGRAGAASRHEPSAGRCTPARANVSALLPGTPLSVSPLPDSYDASPRTQISLLGAPAGAVANLRVSGSATGHHRGVLRAYSQGDGASFIPASPFRSGETVTVTGAVRGARRGARFRFHFTVARQDPLAYVPANHVHGPDPNEKQHFRSQPQLQPPSLAVTASSAQTAAGLLFAAPYGGPGASGPMIFDQTGSLVWFDPLAHGTEAANLQVQQLEGSPVLAWWQGRILEQGFGQGEEVLANSAYQAIDRVHAGNAFAADLHDFQIGPQATALVTVFDPVRCDLSALHGRSNAAVTDGVFQELDLHTGLVRREWHSLDHVPLRDSYSSPHTSSARWPFDYFHINSLQLLPGGRLLMSARNTWTIYELSLRSGQVSRRIGGRHSSVRLARGAAVAFQHDATLLPNGTISVFDNGAEPRVHAQSRGLVLSIDPHQRGSVIDEFRHPRRLLSGSQGNIQQLENGDEFIGWGSQPYFSEFSPTGQLLFDAHMHGSYESYRGYRFAWTGAPAGAPSVAAAPVPAGSGDVTVYASWNGDTRTASWRVLAGASANQLTAVASAPRSGFETAVATPGPAAFVEVQALDANGVVLGTSATITG